MPRNGPQVEARQILQAPRTAHVPTRVVANFARQLATMLHSGVPVLQAIETLSFQEEYPHFGLVVECIAQEIHDGTTLSRALTHHPRLFPSVFVTMTEVGEATGALHASLELVATWLEREDAVHRKVVAAFTYPLSVMAVASLLAALLFTTVLPTFSGIFREMHVELPLLTQIVMGITDLLCRPWVWVLGLLCGLSLWRVWEQIWQSPRQARAVYGLAMRIPGVGGLLRHGALARYSSAASALLASGTDLLKAARLAAQASASPILNQDGRRIVKSIQDGRSLSESLQAEASLYSATLIQLIQAGEEASLLPTMLERVARFHELELNTAIDLLSSTLEPLMLVGVAMLVGCIVLSIYLPMYSTLMNLAG